MPLVPADPNVVHPMPGQPRVVLLKPLVTSPLIEVGDFSYYDDPDDPTAFETRNVLYHYGPEKLIIGKYCALGEGVRFIMNGANHRMDGPSTFPFPIMGGSWADHFDLISGLPGKGDTVSATTCGSGTGPWSCRAYGSATARSSPPGPSSWTTYPITASSAATRPS